MKKKPITQKRCTKNTVLILRTCNADMTSYGGFKYPKRGYVEAPDWKPTYTCGNKLHGLLWGEGSGEYLSWTIDAKCLVIRANVADVLHGHGDFVDKCGFRCGSVVYCGDRFGATSYIQAHGGRGRSIVGGTATAGYRGTVVIRFWDTRSNRYRLLVGYVGDDLKENVAYRVDSGRFVEDK